MRAPHVQDLFLETARRDGVAVTLYLMNGFQLRGTVVAHDAFTILLEYDARQHLVYKHAVSTISPNVPLALGPAPAEPR